MYISKAVMLNIYVKNQMQKFQAPFKLIIGLRMQFLAYFLHAWQALVTITTENAPHRKPTITAPATKEPKTNGSLYTLFGISGSGQSGADRFLIARLHSITTLRFHPSMPIVGTGKVL